MSILGTRAEMIHDLNLILQILIIIILFTGAYYTKRRVRYNIHGRVMGSAVLLNAISILLVMAPRLLGSINFLASTMTQTPSQITVIHPAFGLVAEILGLATIVALRPCGSKMGTNIRCLMRVTFIIWSITFLIGLSVYIAVYAT